MQTDVWAPTNGSTPAAIAAATGPDDERHHTQQSSGVDWDSASFMNPLLPPDLLANPASGHSHFGQHEIDHLQMQTASHQQHQLSQHQLASSQQPHALARSQHQVYAAQGSADVLDRSYDMFHAQQKPSHSPFDNPRFRQPAFSSESPQVSQLGLMGHDFLQYGAFQHAPQEYSAPVQNALPQAHPFDYNASPPLTPDSPHRNASPYTISPVSNHSFATQQDFSHGIDRRPSTADSIHSLHGEYPDDFSSLSLAGVSVPSAGVAPSALHQFTQRNGSHVSNNYLHDTSRSFLAAGSSQTHQQANQPKVFNAMSGQQPFAFHPMSTIQSGQYVPENYQIGGQSIGDPNIPSPFNGSIGPDLAAYIRPILQQYVESRNRIGFGERTIIVMASRVAQKSYGSERRFMCPPPTAIMIGNGWWSSTSHGRDDRRPPRVTISISGESIPPECSVDWSSTTGKPVELGEPPAGDITYIGRAIGKQLFISDERQKKVEALVKVVAPTDEDPERVIGVFPSKTIKVISKPSKKRQSAKNMELCINHGSTISLFHRLRAQTVSTKYLCVSGSGHAFKGSDGQPMPGVDPRSRGNTPSFVARTGTWDPFIIYIVDVNKPTNGPDTAPPPQLHPDYPSPPPNAITLSHHGSNIPIYYNQTIVLQCATSGVVSPVLVIRKVDHDTIAVGGGLQEGAKGVPDHFCAPGEVCGDPVSQLHKVAFEVYDASKGIPPGGSIGVSGTFLSCMGEKVNTYRPSEGRTWTNPDAASHSPFIPDSPGGGSSTGSLTDYFSPTGSPTGSPGLGTSPLQGVGFPPSADGGKVPRKIKRSNTGGGASAGAAGAMLMRGGSSKTRRRVNSSSSTGSNHSIGLPISGSTRYGLADQTMSSGALWSIDIGESAVWTVVGTEQIRYNFYVPPNLPNTVPGIPLKPVTPFPNIVKYLPADRAAENPNHGLTRMMNTDPRAASLMTVYGENFSKTDPPNIFFGTEPSPYVEVKCSEVIACATPEVKLEPGSAKPIFMVRNDGIIYPSNVLFYAK